VRKTLDKALEVIMVAMILVVAAVVILAMMQGQTGTFGQFASGQTNSSDCELSKLKFQRAISCQDSGTSSLNPDNAKEIYDNSDCEWSVDKTTAYNSVC
jgi:hypothetical protein